MNNIIDLNNKKSRKFVALVKNTKNDLLQNSSVNEEIVDALNEVIDTKRLSIISASKIIQIIETRKDNLEDIRNIQDKYSFDLVNEEHRYMEKFINQYFKVIGKDNHNVKDFLVIESIDRTKKEKNSKIKNVFTQYKISEKINITTTSYSTEFFYDELHLLKAYGLVFSDYSEYQSRTNNNDFLSFLKDSVDNNYYLNDSIIECDFSITNEGIEFIEDNERVVFRDNGSFIIEDYEVNVCFSYLFIIDKKTNKKYKYYGD